MQLVFGMVNDFRPTLPRICLFLNSIRAFLKSDENLFRAVWINMIEIKKVLHILFSFVNIF